MWENALEAGMIWRIFKAWPDRPKESRSTSKRSLPFKETEG